MTILVLAGTAEGRDVAAALVAGIGDRSVITSLAGRTAAPVLPPGVIRRGGFGGADGLAKFIAANAITCVVDATHPFARRMTGNAVSACAAAECRYLRLERPHWQREPGDDWRSLPDAAAAAAHLTALSASRVFLATGRADLGIDQKHWFLRRVVDPPPGLPANHHAVVARGPFNTTAETALLREHRIDLIVCKASGGASGAATLAAARGLALPVLMIARPPLPVAPLIPQVTSVSQVLQWLNREGVTPMPCPDQPDVP